MKKLITTQNKDIVISKNRAILNIATKILASDSLIHKEIIEEYIQKIWQWADENGLDNTFIPRDKNLLLDLKKIEFDCLGLDSFIRDLCFLENIKELNLSQNNITELPKEIINFRDLTLLNIKSNPLTLTQNQHIWLKQLKENGCDVYSDFELAQRQTQDVVDESWIERVWEWADENEIAEYILPRDKKRILNLTYLKLDNNQLTELPKEIGKLTNLTKLGLNGSQLTELPKEIGNLTNLTKLGLNRNQLTELPKEIGNLTNLTELSLGDNQLTELPKEIGKLTNLTKLYFHKNNLTELPKEIGNLTNLTKLILHKNKVTELPKEIGNLTNLTELALNENQLTELPKEIWNLTKLTRLYLYTNHLILTTEQKSWISKLRANGCEIID